ncbi:MAG: translocation/assembly module TamB domain-containing protein, partial [Bacteroidaceae bacterium]|nr:translocation/assembly module TamB domain-containing protein [Bacteroidaceae bacterium]
VTYVLRDSPLTVEDRLADLVTFTDFSEDTLKYEKVEVQRQQSMDMQLTIDVEQAAQVHCLLSETGQDYINLEGGGTLTMGYDNTHGMSLSGKYTIRRGEMNYTILPVVGSKHFTIGSNSYVEFDGDMMNPRLNISATERMKSSVSENGGRPRSVTFDVGLEISQTLRDMGLTFTLDAPQDMSVQNELAAMSQEDRGRVAVTMLATGMYVTDLTSTGGFSTSNTLNSYLQNEINNLVDLAQSTIDVNVGIENNTADGRNTTDYSFSFAKRFWGNRISIIIGGKVSTGDDARNTGQSVIDNVSLEYRLDDSATRYVKIYYDHNYESLLEGEITEMGAGVVFRRKTERLGELFLFRQRDKNIIPHGRK